MVSPVLVALDVPSADEAIRLATRLQPHVGGFKVGLELLMGEGPSVVTSIAGLGAPVFVDAKLHDIPNTVQRAITRLGSLGARWITVHASGGEEMLKGAAVALAEASDGTAGVLAVTVLTSLDDMLLGSVGVSRTVADQTLALTELAASAGVEGLVCAASEVGAAAQLETGLTLVTPGIRPAGSDPGDQRRAATPAAAFEAGADLLVVGRPITTAADPVAAAIAIGEEIASVSAARGG